MTPVKMDDDDELFTRQSNGDGRSLCAASTPGVFILSDFGDEKNSQFHRIERNSYQIMPAGSQWSHIAEHYTYISSTYAD